MLIERIRTNNYKASDNQRNGKVIRFAMKQATRKIHHCKKDSFINTAMRQEKKFFYHFLSPDLGIDWDTPIAFMVQYTLFANTHGDSCLEGGGDYSIELKFWWHMEFSADVIKQNLKHHKKQR